MNLERGGDYVGPWRAVRLEVTGLNASPSYVEIPIGPAGTLGYWHTHRDPGSTQGPSVTDSANTVNHWRAPMLILSADSLFLLYPSGKAVGCPR